MLLRRFLQVRLTPLVGAPVGAEGRGRGKAVRVEAILLPLAFVVAWFVLARYVLPRLGVDT